MSNKVKKHTFKEYEHSFLRTNPFFRVLLRETDRMSSSVISLFTTLIGPLVSFILLLSIFSEGVPRNLPVGVVDLDQSNLSRKITMFINASPKLS